MLSVARKPKLRNTLKLKSKMDARGTMSLRSKIRLKRLSKYVAASVS